MQIWKSHTLRFGVLLLLTTILAVSASAVTFTNASLKGGYGYLINRWTADVSVNQNAVVGVMVFDGLGHMTFSNTAVLGGIVQTASGSGTYAINANGTGTITFTTGSNPPVFAIVLNSNAAGQANGFQLLTKNDNNNRIESGTALLQDTAATTYTIANVKGSFGLLLNTWTANSSELEDGILALLTFDGKGKIKGTFSGVSSGVFESGTVTGTYTVNADGHGSFSLIASDGATPTIAFALNTAKTGLAKGLQVLETSGSGNSVHSGTAVKQ
ncbi:MAG: hypothetical protein HY010_00605 [Acidobacteria bacterium]|nr:hypothetical protein [Acidobacteriota bacterium]